MAVTSTNYGRYYTYEGTLAEVMAEIRDEGISADNILHGPAVDTAGTAFYVVVTK